MATAPALEATKVESVLRSAVRRRLFVLAVEQLAFVFSLIFAGLTLLLLLGTQILSPGWIALLGCGGLALALARIRSRRLSRYHLAQLLDSHLHLQDTLSTACFLIDSPDSAEEPFATEQLRRAEQVAQTAFPAAAFPMGGRRPWLLAGAFAAVAFGLFAVRYLVTDSLSLRASLLPLNLAPVLDRTERTADRGPQHEPNGPQSNKKGERKPSATPQTGPETSIPPELAQNKTGEKVDANAQKSTVRRASNGADRPKDGRETSAQRSPPAGQTSDGQPQGNESADSAADPNAKGESQPSANSQNSPGLVDRMRDALSSLMEKMRPNQASGKPSQQGDRKPDDSNAADQVASSKDSGQSQSQNAQSQRTGEQQNSDGQAQAQTTEKTQPGQGRSSDATNEKGNEAHSGIGRQDGDKSLRDAEQLKAMGKLAEIIGKRSANLTGEMTVETPSGKQQLKTAYSQRMGEHSDSGGEINRDEIPLADQQYVRDYMEQVHKEPKGKQQP
ncbi:MAG: hypothetical protein JO217_11015 [Acidobacteriaceae bacterium]|nr:hypothetical protein [Acidobacteriaceae bacterium]